MDGKNYGNVNVSDEVISSVAYLAAKDVPGISAMHNSIGTGIAEFLGKKSLSKGVKINVNGDDVIIDLYVIVDYGIKIPNIAWKVQEKVKAEVENVTGLNVLDVNVHVEGIDLRKYDCEQGYGTCEDDVDDVDVDDINDLGGCCGSHCCCDCDGCED